MSIVKSPIISCSRRTDIPAFLMDWVIDKIKNKQVDVANPFNRKISTISLSPIDVVAWVWWSKNFQPWIDTYTKSPKIFTAFEYKLTPATKRRERRLRTDSGTSTTSCARAI